jgi:hypothetical protein
MFFSYISVAIVAALSLSTANAGKSRRLKEPPKGGLFENVTVASIAEQWVTDNGFGGFTNISDFNFTDIQDRGDPAAQPPYQSVATVTDDNSTEVSVAGGSGSGYGSCVCCKSQGFPSDLDLRGKKGVFKAKYYEGLSCSFVNDYFSGYVCPCKSVCGHYTNSEDFLNDYCKRFLKWTGGDGSFQACYNYVWKCCGYPYYCWKN